MKRLVLIISILLSGSNLSSQGFRLPDMSDSISWDDEKKNKITKFAFENLTKALVIYQNGERVFQYGEVDQPYNIFSVRKSITSTMIGIYTSRGLIDIQSTLRKLGINDKEGLSEQELEARIIDLLKARSGVYHKAAYETPGMEKNRPAREAHKRDEHWYYNNWDFNALTTIFEKITGKSVFEAFQEDIASKLTMGTFVLEDQEYHYEEQSNHPATIWRISANDLALFGLLFLNKGNWEGEQLIPEQWVAESTISYSNLGILGGYGYCWWVAREGQHYPFLNTPEGTYSARGTGEQNLVVIPKYNMVIAHTTEVNSPEDDMMSVVDFGKLMLLILDQSFF